METVKFLREREGVQIGESLRLPLPRPFIGLSPPLGKGYPVCFINISGLTFPEIWEPAVLETLKASPYLYVVLLHPHDGDLNSIKEIFQKVKNPRLSVITISTYVQRILGYYRGGVLMILCDGRGIVRAIEYYPPLRISPRLEEEVADWRPKLHQAVKKVLDEFFPKGKRQ